MDARREEVSFYFIFLSQTMDAGMGMLVAIFHFI